MKVEGPGNTSQTKKSEGKKKAAGTGFDKLVSGAASGVAQSFTTPSVTNVDALLSVQEVEDPTARAAKKRMRERGDKLLNELDNIRMSLLTNTLTIGEVISVADMVASHREKIVDPTLTGILDEIDLRAQVELAKARIAMDNAV